MQKNGVPNYASLYSYWLKVVLTGPDCSCNAQTGANWPEYPLRSGLFTSWPLSVRSGQSGPSGAITKPLWCCEDHFRSVRKWLVCVGTTFCFANISAPWICTEMVLYSCFIYGSQFSEEKMVWKSISQLLKYVKSNQIKKLYIFYGTPFIWINSLFTTSGSIHKLRQHVRVRWSYGLRIQGGNSF